MVERISGVPPIEPIAPMRRQQKKDPEYPSHDHHAMTEEERQEQRRFDEEAKRSGDTIRKEGLTFRDVLKKSFKK